MDDSRNVVNRSRCKRIPPPAQLCPAGGPNLRLYMMRTAGKFAGQVGKAGNSFGGGSTGLQAGETRWRSATGFYRIKLTDAKLRAVQGRDRQAWRDRYRGALHRSARTPSRGRPPGGVLLPAQPYLW